MSEEFTTPVGRIVWGHPLKAQKKKHQSGQDKGKPVLRDGVEVMQWVFGVAFSKADFNAQIWPRMHAEAATLFPNGQPPRFSWKFKDGDGVDAQGKPYNTREGYAGNMVLTVSTEAYAPPVYKMENNAYRQLSENEIKCGDYVAVNIKLKANAPTDSQFTPGLYVNPVGILHVGYGAEIVSGGGDPDEMFGGQTFALPPGASAMPQAPATSVAPPYGAPPAPAQQYAPPAQPQYAPPAAPAQPYYAPAPQQPQYAPPTAPQGYPAPAHDFVANVMQPPAQPQYAPPTAPQGYPAPGAPAQPYPGMPPAGR